MKSKPALFQLCYLVKKRRILSSDAANFHFTGRVKQESRSANEMLCPTEGNRTSGSLASDASHSDETSFWLLIVLRPASPHLLRTFSSPPTPSSPLLTLGSSLFGAQCPGFSCLISLWRLCSSSVRSVFYSGPKWTKIAWDNQLIRLQHNTEQRPTS